MSSIKQFAGVSFMAMACAAAPAFAQSAGSAAQAPTVEPVLAESAGGDIIVTAQRRSERLSDVPSAAHRRTGGASRESHQR